MSALHPGTHEEQVDTTRSSPLSSSSSAQGAVAEEWTFGPRWCGATFAPNGSLIIFRGPRISNTPAATHSSPPALLSSHRAESDGSILDTAYDTAIDDADSAEKLQLPYFHNQSSRPSGSTDHLNSLPSRMHPDARIPMLLASSLDLFHLDSGGNSITGSHSDFLYAPEDEDIFFNVSDGSENGGSEVAYEAEGNDVDAVLDHTFSGAKTRHRRAGSQGIDARTGPRMSFSWNRGEGGAVETSFSSVGGARGLAAVFVSATVDIVPPSSLLPTPSMYSLDCRDSARSCVTNARVARERGCLHLERLWGVMAAVANLKQAVKSAVEDRDQQQQFNAQQQQRQQINGAPPPSAAALPSMNHSAWDFHPLMGGLMDAVMGRLQQMGDTQTGGSIAALGLCNRIDSSGKIAGAVLASSYAETLRGWDMPVIRAVVAKRAFSWCGMDLVHDLKEGSRSKTFTIGPATFGRDISSVKCSVCRLKVMGTAVMCSECGHAGHPDHILAWFSGHTVCPAMGCRCACSGLLQQMQRQQQQQQQQQQYVAIPT